MKKFLAVMLFFTGFMLSAEEPRIESFRIGWLEAQLYLDISAPLPETNPTPKSRFQTEQKIIKEVPRLFVEALAPVVVDSWSSVDDLIKENPSLYRELEQLAEGFDKSFSTPSEDLTSLTVSFSMPLFPYLASLFVHHEGARPLPPQIGYEPTADFTGIIILASGVLPVTGSQESGHLSPALFPRIYDTDMNLVMDIPTTDAETLKKWGTAGYSQTYDLETLQERVGTYPLRIVAQGVFGKYRTDPVISIKDARRILLSENNRKLLEQGRVIILY